MTPNPVPSIPNREAVEALAYHCETVLRADTEDWDECEKCQSLAPTLRTLRAEVERLTAIKDQATGDVREVCATNAKLNEQLSDLRATVAAQAAELEMIANIAEGSTTANSLQHIAKIARAAIASQ